MSLSDYAVKSQRNRWNQTMNREEWVLTYVIPESKVASERANMRPVLENKLPGQAERIVVTRWDGAGRRKIHFNVANSLAPCIVDSFEHASELPGCKEVVCVYARPTRGMLLSLPGRGDMRFETYETTVTKEVPLVMKHVTKRALVDEVRAITRGELADDWWKNHEIPYQTDVQVYASKQGILELSERGLVILDLVDSYFDLPMAVDRALAWIGKGGSFTIGGHTYGSDIHTSNQKPAHITEKTWVSMSASEQTTAAELLRSNAMLKLSKVSIARREDDGSLIDSTWAFAYNAGGFKHSGVGTSSIVAYDENGNKAELTGDTVKDGTILMDTIDKLKPRNYTGGELHMIQLYNQDMEIVNGAADFSPVETYFEWMPVAQ